MFNEKFSQNREEEVHRELGVWSGKTCGVHDGHALPCENRSLRCPAGTLPRPHPSLVPAFRDDLRFFAVPCAGSAVGGGRTFADAVLPRWLGFCWWACLEDHGRDPT
jgi:hypothetical protein